MNEQKRKNKRQELKCIRKIMRHLVGGPNRRNNVKRLEEKYSETDINNIDWHDEAFKKTYIYYYGLHEY